MKKLTTLMASLLFAASAVAEPQAAEETIGPNTPAASDQQVEETFGDWSRICTTSEENKVCQIVQTANQNESGRLIFQTAVGFVADNDKPIMYMTAPLGIFLPRGLSIFVDDETDGITATVQRCDANGCLGVLAMKQDLIDKLKKGNSAKVIFGVSAQQNVSVPMSLTGFTNAFNTLQ